MPYQGQPSEVVKALIAKLVDDDKRKGGLWSTITDPGAGGTGTAAHRLEQHRVPDAARTLVGWRPVEYPENQAADESLVAVFTIEGSNYNFQPQEVICGVVGGAVLTTGGVLHQPSEYYDVFAPVKGGETLDIYIEPIDAIAGDRRSAVEMWWTNVKLPLPVIRSMCSREVATGTAVGAVAGTTLSLTNTKELIEVGGVITTGAHTVEEQAWASVKLKCTGWRPVQEEVFLLEPAGVIADLTVDEGATIALLARRAARLEFLHDTATIICQFDMDIAMTTAGQLAHYLRWI